MFKRNKSKLVLASMALLATLGLAGCGSTERNTNQLVVGMGANPTNLDLHAANDNPSSVVGVQIFETLVFQDENLKIHPGLAVDWRPIDERTYEFDLKQGVLFHNGEELKASDVEFTLLRALESAQIAAIVGEIDPETIKVIDDHTIQIGTHEPFAPFLNHLAHSAAGIMNEKHVLDAEARGVIAQEPIGTGPFKFVNWNPGDRVELVRFEDYHGELPAYEELIIRTITEGGNRTMELETGEIDIALDIIASDITRVDNHRDLTLHRGDRLNSSYLAINTEREPFNDVRVRQALNYAINMQEIVDTILEGVGSVIPGPLGPLVWGANPDLTGFEFNPERARELLAEAGLADGFTMEIMTNQNDEREAIVTAIQNQLADVGIEARMQRLEFATYLEMTGSGDFDVAIMGWTAVTGDADYGLFPTFHSSFLGAAGNRPRFVNEDVDRLLENARATSDANARLRYYAEAQEIIVDQAPWVFMTTGETIVGTRADVNGLRLSPVGHHRFANVYFEGAEKIAE